MFFHLKVNPTFATIDLLSNASSQIRIMFFHLKVNPTFATIDLLSNASSQIEALNMYVKPNKTLSNSGKNPGLLKVKL
jgi:hypothetical protein